ncbi:DciA family protein [Corynebacterium mastitidis]|uniref:DciA family protein n=1 Tax=Corynebacterium mastitidis TaxID=161890 RepID=A0ABU8NWN3_9CORY
MSDPINQAFEAMRAAALKRNGSVPSLNLQGGERRRARSAPTGLGGALQGAGEAAAQERVRVPGLAGEDPDTRQRPGSARRRRGIPTGPDGRRMPRRRDVDTLGSIVNREIRQRGWAREIAGGWVTGHWQDLVGEKIAAHTRVEMLKGSTLFISCDSTAWATNLRMMQREILRTIAAKVGPDGITELKIFGPKAPSWRHGALHVAGRGPRDTYG